MSETETTLDFTWMRRHLRTGDLITDADGWTERSVEPGPWHIEHRLDRPGGRVISTGNSLCGRRLGQFRPQRATGKQPEGDVCRDCLRRGFAPGGPKPRAVGRR